MTLTLTRVRIAATLARPFKVAYLRALIRGAEADVRYMQHEIARVPLLLEQIQLHRATIEALRVQVIQAGGQP